MDSNKRLTKKEKNERCRIQKEEVIISSQMTEERRTWERGQK